LGPATLPQHHSSSASVRAHMNPSPPVSSTTDPSRPALVVTKEGTSGSEVAAPSPRRPPSSGPRHTTLPLAMIVQIVDGPLWLRLRHDAPTLIATSRAVPPSDVSACTVIDGTGPHRGPSTSNSSGAANVPSSVAWKVALPIRLAPPATVPVPDHATAISADAKIGVTEIAALPSLRNTNGRADEVVPNGTRSRSTTASSATSSPPAAVERRWTA
jgi:hypothetical protein